MNQKSLKILYKAGILTSVVAEKADFDDGWLLYFKRHDGVINVINTFRNPNKAKIFRSLDAAAAASNEIGFSKMEVKLN